MKYIVTFLLLFSSTVLAQQYYGYIGNCSDTAYEFNFDEGSYKLYSVARLSLNGVKNYKYSITNGVIKNQGGAFYMYASGTDPIALSKDPSGDTIWGESKAYGKHYYQACSPESVTELMANAKKN